MRKKIFPEVNKKSFIVKHSSKFCFALALILIFTSYIVTLPAVQKSLAAIDAEFVNLENFIAGFNHLIAFFIIKETKIIKHMMMEVILVLDVDITMVSNGGKNIITILNTKTL